MMAEITRKLAANTRRQFFFVIIITASTRYLVEIFQLQPKPVNARLLFDSKCQVTIHQ